MIVRVMVEEWNLGDWRRDFAAGDQVRFHAYVPGPDYLLFIRRLLGDVANTVTYAVDHSGTRDTFELRGEVTAIHAVYSTFPDRAGGKPITGSGRLEPVERATAVVGDVRPDLGMVTNYLFEISTEPT